MTRKEVGVAAGLAVVCAIFAAPLGEIILHALARAAEFVGRVSTLGINSLIDGQYESAAATFGRATNVASFVTLFFCMVFLVFTLVAIYAAREYTKVVPTAHVDSIMRGTITFGFFAVGLVVPLMISVTQSAYVYKLARTYERREILAAPYLAERDLKSARAEFVRVKSKDDYDRLMARLAKVIMDNHAVAD